MKSKKNYKIKQARGKRKKRKKKSGDEETVASSDCDSDLKLNISHKRLKANDINETSESNSQHEETLDFNETIKRKKKSSDDESVASSDCDSDFQTTHKQINRSSIYGCIAIHVLVH